jgi:uncharacterized DUF497 family protein
LTDVATVVSGDFEWDDVKAAANMSKHGISFEEAATVFADGSAVFVEDPGHTGRFHVIGASGLGQVLFVVHVERGARERIISARKATSAEENFYVQGSNRP